MRIIAPAKINLHLHITGKRKDGYHFIESMVMFADCGDVIDIAPAEKLSLDIKGPFSTALQKPDDNLVMKAAKALQAIGSKKGARITLTKNLPVGAGIGGGSSDAAATLKGLSELWNLSLQQEDMLSIAASLGSDVPACHKGKPAWIRGVGDQITPVEVKVPLWAVLCNPGKPLMTADVYNRFDGVFAAMNRPIAAFERGDELQAYFARKNNMLQPAAFSLLPELEYLIDRISATQDCLLARMSGSGSTCFGIYGKASLAQRAADELKKECPGYWVVLTKLYTPDIKKPLAA